MTITIEAGKEYLAKAPFCRTTHIEWNSEGSAEVLSWRPGTFVIHDSDLPEDYDEENQQDGYPTVCAAEGFAAFVVLAVVPMPNPFIDRVIYYREWIGPDGKRFGKKKIKMAATGAFKRMLKGWRHPYLVDIERANAEFKKQYKEYSFGEEYKGVLA